MKLNHPNMKTKKSNSDVSPLMSMNKWTTRWIIWKICDVATSYVLFNKVQENLWIPHYRIINCQRDLKIVDVWNAGKCHSCMPRRYEVYLHLYWLLSTVSDWLKHARYVWKSHCVRFRCNHHKPVHEDVGCKHRKIITTQVGRKDIYKLMFKLRCHLSNVLKALI